MPATTPSADDVNYQGNLVTAADILLERALQEHEAIYRALHDEAKRQQPT